ncbi:MAG TPA: tannase/feruloyl esterase family alpha/beta hydrolase [Methylomirabilota bacterium]|nr:tannase/feruloyl esterase family alpha/beta hydrolase [Methylomirabilota bacterium]
MRQWRNAGLPWLVIGLVLGMGSACYGQVQGAGDAIAPSESCAALMRLQVEGVTLAISKAEFTPTAPAGTIRPSPFSPDTIPVPVPSYCRVEGAFDQRTGVDGKPYAIGFAMALPDQWNGRFLFQGGGGLNGFVGEPYGATAAGTNPALARGFAVVSTDTGHKGAPFDSSFMKDQQAALNFDYLAIGRVAILAKQIIAKYYARPASHSYYVGCSTGGREGMVMSQRYPTYFDGIVSGDPAMNTGYSNVGLSWARKAFAEIAPKDAQGNPEPSKDFSSADKKLLVEAILSACDDKDGLKDGMIFNRKDCHFDPSILKCRGAKSDQCLSSNQVDALQKAFSGPRDSAGNQVYVPFPYDADMVAELQGPGLSFLPMPGPDILSNVLPPNVTVDQQVAGVRANANQILTDTTTWTNLSTFFGHGGKLIFYHGTSDPWFSFLDTLGYYERMTKDNGGRERVENWSRIYLVPGMSHCGGGPMTVDEFDMLTAVVDWVEKGTPPDSVTATGHTFPGRSRPLCPHPKYARYKGQGDSEDARNFACVE